MNPVLYNKQYSFTGLLLTVSVLILSCESSKILIYPLDGSHWVNMKLLVEALHSKGHEITVIRQSSSFFIKEDPSLYSIIPVNDDIEDLKEFYDEYLEKHIQIQRGQSSTLTFLKMQMDFLFLISHLHLLSCNTIGKIIEDKELVKRLQDEQYDLVLTDPALTGGVLLGHYLNLPFVL